MGLLRRKPTGQLACLLTIWVEKWEGKSHQSLHVSIQNVKEKYIGSFPMAGQTAASWKNTLKEEDMISHEFQTFFYLPLWALGNSWHVFFGRRDFLKIWFMFNLPSGILHPILRIYRRIHHLGLLLQIPSWSKSHTMIDHILFPYYFLPLKNLLFLFHSDYS